MIEQIRRPFREGVGERPTTTKPTPRKSCEIAAAEIDEATALLPPKAASDDATALLIKARALVERGWCRGKLAVDANGEEVAVDSDRAVAWDAIGAIRALEVSYGVQMTMAVLCRLTAAVDGIWAGAFNDDQESVYPVLAAFDRAIAGEREVRP